VESSRVHSGGSQKNNYLFYAEFVGTCNIALIVCNGAQDLPLQYRNDFFDFRKIMLYNLKRTTTYGQNRK
jgi:hypothetical protein